MEWVESPAGRALLPRLLLRIVPGCLARCYEHLRTVDGRLLLNFGAACVAMGLSSNGDEWTETLHETGGFVRGDTAVGQAITGLSGNIVAEGVH